RRSAPTIIVEPRRGCQRNPLHAPEAAPAPSGIGDPSALQLPCPADPHQESESVFFTPCPQLCARVEQLWIVWTAEGPRTASDRRRAAFPARAPTRARAYQTRVPARWQGHCHRPPPPWG